MPPTLHEYIRLVLSSQYNTCWQHFDECWIKYLWALKLVEYCDIACAQLSTYKRWRHMHINCTNTNTHTTIFSCLDVSQWNTVWHDDIAVAKPSTTSCSACQPKAYICKGKKVEPNFRLPSKEKNTTRRRNKNSWRCVCLLCHTKLHHFRIFDFALIWSLFFFFPSSPKKRLHTKFCMYCIT